MRCRLYRGYSVHIKFGMASVLGWFGEGCRGERVRKHGLGEILRKTAPRGAIDAWEGKMVLFKNHDIFDYYYIFFINFFYFSFNFFYF